MESSESCSRFLKAKKSDSICMDHNARISMGNERMTEECTSQETNANTEKMGSTDAKRSLPILATAPAPYKLRTRLPSSTKYKDKRPYQRRYLRQKTSDLSNEMTNCLSSLELSETETNQVAAATENMTSGDVAEHFRHRMSSQEVIPAVACESDAIIPDEIPRFQCRVRHYTDAKTWTRTGRKVKLGISTQQDLFAFMPMEGSPESPPHVFAYRGKGKRWYFVCATDNKQIVARRTDGGISASDVNNPRAAFHLDIDGNSNDEGMFITSGAHKGQGIAVKRNKLILSDDRRMWSKWIILSQN